jgi:hypothetical protein
LDIPELSEKQLAGLRRVGRPTLGDEPGKPIAIRPDPKQIPYQSLVNQILAEEMRKAS